MATTNYFDDFDPNKPLTDWMPSTQGVDESKGTVAGRMDDILSKDNPFLTRARNSAAQGAQSRGLLNSSLAAGAGEAAAIEAALPIAQQDAQTWNTQSLTNQEWLNQAGQFNANADNTKALAGYQGFMEDQSTSRKFGYEQELQQEQQDWQTGMQREQQVHEIGMEGLKQEYNQANMNLDASLRNFLDENANQRDAAIEAGKQTAGIIAQHLDSISGIQQADMTQEGKDAAIHNLELSLTQGLNTVLSTFEGYDAFGGDIMDSFRATVDASGTLTRAITNYNIGTTTEEN